ncbi:MAG: hypothetical protein WCU80_09140 [Paludibacteraceae bacterium]
MKTWKFILTMCLCALIAVSCSKDDDDPVLNPSDIPTGKVALDMYGMRAFFPENEWGNVVDSSYLSGAFFQRECVVTFLKSDFLKQDGSPIVDADGNLTYLTNIYFSRFKEHVSDATEADSLINSYHSDFLEGLYDDSETKSDPNLPVVSLSEVNFAQISTFPASRIETVNKSGFYQDNYFVYNNNKLYMLTISIADSLKDTQKYKDCLAIVNTLKLK